MSNFLRSRSETADFEEPNSVKDNLPELPPIDEVRFINKVVAIVLASGMYLSIGFYLVGLLLLFVKGGKVPDISKEYYHSFGSFFVALLSLSPKSFLYLGTIVLILTPISRVFISIFAFWKEKDRKFVVVTTIVFIVILASVVVGSVFKINVG
jgi:uncharacterized membrane protein